jgi:hypothetical protein
MDIRKLTTEFRKWLSLGKERTDLALKKKGLMALFQKKLIGKYPHPLPSFSIV